MQESKVWPKLGGKKNSLACMFGHQTQDVPSCHLWPLRNDNINRFESISNVPKTGEIP